MAKVYPAIPEPNQQNLQEAVRALKQVVETLIRLRGPTPRASGAVTFQDLVDLGLINASQIPK